MPHKIDVNFDVSVDGQSYTSGTRTFSANAYDSIDHTIDKDTTSEVTISDVLPADPAEVHALILTASAYGEDLKLKFEGGTLSALHHPILLFGGQVSTFLDGPNENLVVKNETGSDIHIRVLVARESSSSS